MIVDYDGFPCRCLIVGMCILFIPVYSWQWQHYSNKKYRQMICDLNFITINILHQKICSWQRPGQTGEVHLTPESRVSLEQTHDDGHGGLVIALAGGRGWLGGVTLGQPRPRHDLVWEAPVGLEAGPEAWGGGKVTPRGRGHGIVEKLCLICR